MGNVRSYFSDLVPVAHFAQSFILFFHREEIDTAEALCIQANSPFKCFNVVIPIGNYLKFNPFEPIDFINPDLWPYYHEEISSLVTKAEISRGAESLYDSYLRKI